MWDYYYLDEIVKKLCDISHDVYNKLLMIIHLRMEYLYDIIFSKKN